MKSKINAHEKETQEEDRERTQHKVERRRVEEERGVGERGRCDVCKEEQSHKITMPIKATQRKGDEVAEEMMRGGRRRRETFFLNSL